MSLQTVRHLSQQQIELCQVLWTEIGDGEPGGDFYRLIIAPLWQVFRGNSNNGSSAWMDSVANLPAADKSMFGQDELPKLEDAEEEEALPTLEEEPTS